MKKDTSEYYHPKDQLNKTKEIHDQYNTLEKPEYNYTESIINSNLEFTPSPGQTWESYAIEAQIYQKTNEKISTASHINPPKGAWYTHRMPAGCFICNDANLISVLVQTIAIMASKYPKQKY